MQYGKVGMKKMNPLFQTKTLFLRGSRISFFLDYFKFYQHYLQLHIIIVKFHIILS